MNESNTRTAALATLVGLMLLPFAVIAVFALLIASLILDAMGIGQ